MSLTAERAQELAREAVTRCRALAQVSDVPGRTTRTFLSEGMRRANDKVAGWMADAGLQTRMDAAGNLRGVLPSQAAGARRFLIVSHLDTVPDAGAFDGPLGVLMGIALAAECRLRQLPFHLEVIGFSEEEGVRFALPFLGSRAVVGSLDEAALATRDREGVSVREAMHRYGLSSDLREARILDAMGCFEFHIEQGPELDTEGLPLGAVETIAGQSRLRLTMTGRSNHAGTTPMRLRHDAMCAAAAFTLAVEQYAGSRRGLVATVGSIEAWPNATNVIAGRVTLSLDVRSAADTVRTDAVAALLEQARTIAYERGIELSVEQGTDQSAVPMDRNLLRLLEDSLDRNGVLIRRMVSGAGHDAMILAAHMPTAMLFLASPEGISHHPNERVRTEDVALALCVGDSFLGTLAEQTRNGGRR